MLMRWIPLWPRQLEHLSVEDSLSERAILSVKLQPRLAHSLASISWRFVLCNSRNDLEPSD